MTKPLLAALLLLAACTTSDEPSVDVATQAVEGVEADQGDPGTADEDATCPADPAEAQAGLDEAYGASAPAALAGRNCWREYDQNLARCDAMSRWCDTLPPIDRGACYRSVSDCRSMARSWYWACIWYRPWQWCRSWGQGR